MIACALIYKKKHAYVLAHVCAHVLCYMLHNVYVRHGEYSYTAIDSGVPNLLGARSIGQCSGPCKTGHPYVLQRGRAAAAEAQSRKMASVPHLVGYHWWR